MNKRKISKLLLQKISTLRGSAGYFFRSDFEDLLHGFAVEHVPRGVYIWRFRFPLCDPFGPNLLYSNRITDRGGFVGNGELTEEDFVDFVTSTHEVHEALNSTREIGVGEFVQFLESTPDLLDNPHARLIYAAALLLNGEEARSAALLDAKLDLNEKDDTFRNLLQTQLRSGAVAARKVLDEVRRVNLRSLGLIS
ncbi:MAG TPA: hypothetical protein VD932_06285 [Aquabacterium sp.]|nr:hypothetical protein [Aquabacterium sp.]